MKKKIADKPVLILGSASPRRRDFLAALGLSFDTIVPDVSEAVRKGEEKRTYARRVAVDKARDVFAQLAELRVKEDLEHPDLALTRESPHDDFLILAADTIVVLGRKFLQKPKSAGEAARMLKALSGKTHEVISGVCVLKVEEGAPVKERAFTVVSRVTFKTLSKPEIDGYVSTKEPMDKAGAYAVQGVGSFLVKSIAGSYTNVVGLPLAELTDLLRREFSYPVF